MNEQKKHTDPGKLGIPVLTTLQIGAQKAYEKKWMERQVRETMFKMYGPVQLAHEGKTD